jgi:hypothetical protein
MRTRTAIGTAVAATAIGGLLFTSGAVAVADHPIRNAGTTGVSAGPCWGSGFAGGSGMMGARPASAPLTAQQKTTLAALAEEEKLAHDVYVALGADHGDERFSRIATAEQGHLSMLRTLMARYDVTDPTAGQAAGAFTSSTVARQYAELVARGTTSLAAALEVGRGIERADITDLNAAGRNLQAADVSMVYAHLSMASAQHLRAFGG